MNSGPDKKATLEMVDISKSFPGVKALDNVNLRAYPGQVVGLVGENGAGKSTLMNILGGVVRKDAGRIVIEGNEVDPKSPLDAQALGIAFIHQEPSLFLTLSIAENIFITKLARRKPLSLIDHAKINAAAATAIEKLGVELNPRSKVKDVLMGQRQIVEIARAISAEARIIIFDEPTSSLTVNEKNRLFEVIRSLKNRGVAVIYISHLLEELFEIGDQLYILRDGRIVGIESPKGSSLRQIIELMIGRELEKFFPQRRSSLGKEILRAENLSRRGVLRDISISVRCGEIVGLWGLMGSGRTELARALLGLDPIDGGKLWFDGRQIPLSAAGQVMRRSGFIPENRREEGIFPSMTVLENMSMANLKSLLSVSRVFINRKKERNLAVDLVRQLRIMISNLGQRIEHLSGGNQQKVVIARWLQRRPDLYVLDEPTRGLDVGSKAEIHSIAGYLADHGAGILLISSEIEELLGMSDRILVLKSGKIVAAFDRGTATKERLIEAAASWQVGLEK